MSFQTKRRLMFGLLLLLLAWIPLHGWLVRRFELNPWKFSGWAMYTRPQPTVYVRFFDAGGEQLRPLEVAQISDRHRDATTAFLRRRQHLGKLLRPDALVPGVLADNLEVERLAVVVTHEGLDPETAMMVPKRFGYHYRRQEGP